MKRCFSCGHEFGPNDEIVRSTVCPECGKDARVCKNCTFYSPGSHWDCRETIDEPVRDKESANFCGYFSFKTNDKSGPTRPGSKAPDSKKDFLKLFGDE